MKYAAGGLRIKSLLKFMLSAVGVYCKYRLFVTIILFGAAWMPLLPIALVVVCEANYKVKNPQGRRFLTRPPEQYALAFPPKKRRFPQKFSQKSAFSTT